MARNTASQALADIAWLTPETCSMRAPRIAASGTSAGPMRLAALPAR